MDKRELRDRILPRLLHGHDCPYLWLGLCDCTANENLERTIDLIGDPGPISRWFWHDIAAQLHARATGVSPVTTSPVDPPAE